MSSNSDTSMWVKFFTEANIPDGDAINYAIIFTENRIKLHMLMDLNKDYLRDMGITIMGDVIAILKHTKVFCGQQRVLQAAQSTPLYDGCAPPPKKSTPATRMPEHYVQKEDPPPPSGSPNLSQSMSARLGSGLKRSAEDDGSLLRGKHIKRTVAAMDSNKNSSKGIFEKNLAAKKKSLAAVATMNADTTPGSKSRLGLQSSSTGDLTKSAGIFARKTEEANKMKSGKPSSSAAVRLTVGKKMHKVPSTKELERRLLELESYQREVDKICIPPLPIEIREKRYNKITQLLQNTLRGSKENVTTGSPSISSSEEEDNDEAI